MTLHVLDPPGPDAADETVLEFLDRMREAAEEGGAISAAVVLVFRKDVGTGYVNGAKGGATFTLAGGISYLQSRIMSDIEDAPDV